mgnify:CR=1 FL=1
MISKNKYRITITLSKELIRNIDTLVNQNKTRSDIIELILRDYFKLGVNNEKKRN